jgi:hypothetical protein
MDSNQDLNRGMPKQKQGRGNGSKDATFLTSVANTSTGNMSKKNSKVAGKAQFSSQRDVEADEFNEYASKQQSVEEDNQYERASDIDFDADYSDEEMEIKFKN